MVNLQSKERRTAQSCWRDRVTSCSRHCRLARSICPPTRQDECEAPILAILAPNMAAELHQDKLSIKYQLGDLASHLPPLSRQVT
jgi:hypothetical protein